MQTNLGEHQSIWVATANMIQNPSLTSDLRTDVCVVGAGIAGLTTAYQLVREGVKVVVLDDGPIGGGESSRTTAQLTYMLDKGYAETARLRGVDGARLAAASHRAAIDTIEQIVATEQIDCDFMRVDGYLFAPPGDDGTDLREELEALRRAGITDASYIDHVPIDGVTTGPALHIPHQGQFHVLRYLQGLARAIEQLGGQIYSGTRVHKVHGGTPTRLEVAGGYQVIADATVLATNAPINDMLGYSTRLFAYRTYVIAAQIPSGSMPQWIGFDTLDPYHYVRLQPGDGHDILLVGGEDHRTGQPDSEEDPFAALETWMRETFPMAGPITNSWSGQVLNSLDGLAFIGPDLVDQHVFVITGDTGIGMTHGTLGGMIISDLIGGISNPWAELYHPARLPLAAAGEVLHEGGNTITQYKELIIGGDVSSERVIAPDTGAIVGWGLTKRAVYCDAQGNLHRYSAICPHAGCVVGWNDIEKSWDCPCHGSRFDAYGKLLNGPANADMDSA